MKSPIKFAIAAAIALLIYFSIGWLRHSTPKPPVPVALTFRKSLADSSQVAILRNESGAVFPVTVKVTRDSAAPLIRAFDINPNVTVEVGPHEGWSFKTGDVVELSSEGFETTTTTLP